MIGSPVAECKQQELFLEAKRKHTLQPFITDDEYTLLQKFSHSGMHLKPFEQGYLKVRSYCTIWT